MRLKPYSDIWITWHGKTYPGTFICYSGNGTVKTVSEFLSIKTVPRSAIKPRTSPRVYDKHKEAAA